MRERHEFHDCVMDRYYMQCICICTQGHGTDQAVPPVHSQVTSYEIPGRKFAIETGFSPSYFDFTPLIIIPSLLCGQLSPISSLCYSPDQAAQYHILGLCVQTFLCLSQNLVRYRVKNLYTNTHTHGEWMSNIFILKYITVLVKKL